MIAIRYTKTDGINVFSDTLHLEDDHCFTEGEIEAMKQSAYERWLAVVYYVAPEEVIEIV